MVNSMVDRATSDMLIGPDWAMNIEICDICNHDPTQAKNVVKGLRKRVTSKNSKVQLLALTLLETLVKNCGDVVHMHIAEKGVLNEMVRIVKKKPDVNVKEKVLILIDTWQEAFGGQRARYPQYYAAYQELLRMGAVFPQRSENSAPVFTPPQSQPLPSYPPNLRNHEALEDGGQPSVDSDFPSLSMSEIQNARGIMDVLADMLNALDPGSKEDLNQDVIMDLVDQCRNYKQRVVHLVNSTSDESLLSEGLSLNDDLQRLLAKHEALASGKITIDSKDIKITKSPASLVDIDQPLVTTENQVKNPDLGSASSSTLNQLLLPPPSNANTSASASKIDLLSGYDDYATPNSATSLALVPVGEAQSAAPSNQNELVLFDMFSNGDAAPNHGAPPAVAAPTPAPTSSSGFAPAPGSVPAFSVPSNHPPQSFSSSDTASYATGISPQFHPTVGQFPPWNGATPQPPAPAPAPAPSNFYGGQMTASLPPPPWDASQPETSPPANHQHPFSMQIHQNPVGEQHMSPYAQPMPAAAQPGPPHLPGIVQTQPGSHRMGPFGQPMPQQGSSMGPIYPPHMYGNAMPAYGYGYGYNQGNQYLEQHMYGLSVRNDTGLRNSNQAATSSYLPTPKPSKPEDKLFGDLVDIAKFKQPKSGRSGTM